MDYLFHTDDLDGPMNMAVDEAIWGAASNGSTFMRLYSWPDRPVLSLGYFQDAHTVQRDPRLAKLPFVRRLTGGGAIVHDDEITYSLALPGPSAPRTNELYERVHSAVALRLCELGIPASVGDANDHRPSDLDLCFARNDRFAVRVCGVKVLGSAQRRRPESVLMHGSLLLGRSIAAPDIVGLRELVGELPDIARLRQALAQAVQMALNLTLGPIELPDAIRQRALQLAEVKYRTPEWNQRPRYGPEVGGNYRAFQAETRASG